MTINPIINTLKTIGLTEDEAKAYVVIADHGAINISTLARKLSITRVTAYSLIKNLITKKCVMKTKLNKRFLYQAEDPKNLLSRFENMYKEGAQALSILSANQNKNLFVPEIKMYSGSHDITKIYDDIGMVLPKGGTYFRYTSRVQDQERSPLYSKLRVEKEIERLVITSEKKSATKNKDSNRFIKTVPKDFAFDDDVTVLIYGTKVAHIDFNSNTGIVIESPHLARFQEKIFKLLWKRL